MDFDDDVEENFPTAPIDGLVWSDKPIPDRDICTYMAPDTSETSYPFQISMPLQESINEPITQKEPMDSTDIDIPQSHNVPKEGLLITTLDQNSLECC